MWVRKVPQILAKFPPNFPANKLKKFPDELLQEHREKHNFLGNFVIFP